MNASRVLVFLLLLVAAGVAVAMLMFRGDQQVPPDLTTPTVAQGTKARDFSRIRLYKEAGYPRINKWR